MVSKGLPCEKCRGGKFWKVIDEHCYTEPRGAAWVLAAEAYAHKWLKTYEHCVARFLAPSRFVKQKFADNGWDSSRIDVLPHFQDVPRQHPQPCGAGAPILYFGRLSAEKGVSDLLRAIARLPGIQLLIAGDGPQRGELEDLAKGLKLTNVRFEGHIQGSRLEALIASSKFSVFPSRAYETMGKTILESFAGGRAVIASDLGSRRELVEDGRTGLMFRPGDTDQLTNLISLLYRAPELATTMGNAGYEYVRREHSQHDHYLELVRIYGELFHAKKSAAPARSLRVAFIGGRGLISKYSGIETYYEEAGSGLSGLGHKVTIYCRSYFTPPLAAYKGMRLVRLPTIRAKHLDTWVHTLLSTIHVLFSDCDIVHYHGLGPALFALIPRLAGKKTVVTVQGLDWQRKKWGWIASNVLRLGEQAAARFPDATMVVSRTLQERYSRQHHVQTVYVPNGTNVRKSKTTARLGDWGLDAGNYILFLGRFSPEKNCHLLIEAYENLNPRAKLVLAGGSSYSDSYTLALRKHQSEQIRILDWVFGDDLCQLLANALLFVLPSELEGQSVALLEAMGAGVCVLASDIPENCELVDGAGYTFQTGNVADLENMMRILLGSVQLRAGAAKKAQQRAQGQYRWPQIARQIEQVYLDMMEGSPSRQRSDRSAGQAA